jgi:hypothetical protein
MLISVSAGADFRLDIDEATGTIVQQPVGHWSVDTVSRWEDTMRALTRRRRETGSAYRTLIDLRERSPHAQDVAIRLQSAFSRQAANFDRIAFVFPISPLMTMQSKRIVDATNSRHEHQRHFAAEDFPIAYQWIFEPRADLARAG